MPVSVVPLTTSSIKASLQLDHFFTWCTIVKIYKDRENKAAEKSIDAEVPNYGIPVESGQQKNLG